MERAMNPLDVMTVHWNQTDPILAEWRRRARSHDEFMNLSDRILKDIGMSHCTAEYEAARATRLTR
jgi:uncharacterized protein YjiS (DUF1127 family)